MTLAGGRRMTTRKRWVLHLRDVFGRRKPVLLQVRDGYVYGASRGDDQAKLSPEDVSRVRNALAEAQAEALRQRGGVWE